jgi:hypothetical protein
MGEERRTRTAAERLEAVVRLLGMPGADALARAGLTRPDALAIDFDEAYTAFVGTLGALPTEPQLEALQELDAQLLEMSDPARQSLWTAEAMAADATWDTLRIKARAVLRAFDWSDAGES